MFGWLRKKLLPPSPLAQWSVRFRDGHIVTKDGQGDERTLPVKDLRRVVVATDDSGPWGADVVFLLYSHEPEPVGLFPLEAAGRDDFVKWMGSQPGFRNRELAKSMSSTQVTQFEVLVIEQSSS